MRDENDGRREIHRECDDAECAHQLGLRLSLNEYAECGGDQDTESQRAEEDPLDQRRSRAPRDAPADREQPEHRDQPVADEIECIRLQRLRIAEKSARHLDHAVPEIEHDDDYERASIAWFHQPTRTCTSLAILAGARPGRRMRLPHPMLCISRASRLRLSSRAITGDTARS